MPFIVDSIHVQGTIIHLRLPFGHSVCFGNDCIKNLLQCRDVSITPWSHTILWIYQFIWVFLLFWEFFSSSQLNRYISSILISDLLSCASFCLRQSRDQWKTSKYIFQIRKKDSLTFIFRKVAEMPSKSYRENNG